MGLIEWIVLLLGWCLPRLLEELLQHVEELGALLLLELALPVELVLLQESLSPVSQGQGAGLLVNGRSPARLVLLRSEESWVNLTGGPLGIVQKSILIE